MLTGSFALRALQPFLLIVLATALDACAVPFNSRCAKTYQDDEAAAWKKLRTARTAAENQSSSTKEAAIEAYQRDMTRITEEYESGIESDRASGQDLETQADMIDYRVESRNRESAQAARIRDDQIRAANDQEVRDQEEAVRTYSEDLRIAGAKYLRCLGYAGK